MDVASTSDTARRIPNRRATHHLRYFNKDICASVGAATALGSAIDRSFLARRVQASSLAGDVQPINADHQTTPSSKGEGLSKLVGWVTYGAVACAWPCAYVVRD